MPSRVALQTLVEHVRQGGIPDWCAARKALGATLGTLGTRLTDDEASALASRLPPELARVVEEEDYDHDFDAEELYERVCRRTGAPPGLAREQTDIVLRAMGEVLDASILSRLTRVLPEPCTRNFRARPSGAPEPHAARSSSAPKTTLAAGRPGSSHPLSEGAPPGAHSQSVAMSDDPHAETKLSSSRGLTQERLDETLATGRPPKPPRTLG